MKHTQGAWVRVSDDAAWTIEQNISGRFIARVRAGDQEDEANCQLIMHAPDLLRELAHLVRLLEPLEREGELDVPGLATLNGARAAIAKAQGEEPR